MIGQRFVWGAAFGLAVGAAAFLAAGRERAPLSPPKVEPRDPGKVSDLEVELILTKIREGDLLSIKKDPEGADRAWKEARERGKGLWPVHEGLGDSYARAERYEEAIGQYRTAETLLPESLEASRRSLRAKRAAMIGKAGRPFEAIRTYLNCGVPRQTGSAIIALAREAGPDRAAEIIRAHARDRDPRALLLLYHLNEDLEREKEAAIAFGDYLKEVSPWEGPLVQNAVGRLRKVGEYERAIELLRAWIRSTPHALLGYRLMGDVYREWGREREAILAYTSIVDLRPGDAQAHRTLGKIFAELGKTREAIVQYERARSARPEDGDLYHVLRKLYEEVGEKEASEKLLVELIRRFGNSGSEAKALIASLHTRLAELRAKGDVKEVTALRHRLGRLGDLKEGIFDIKVVMTWDVQSDVDLDVVEPDGTVISHANRKSPSGGIYFTDNTTAYGPEFYTLKDAPPGTYKVGAHLHSGKRSKASFTVILFEGTDREERRKEEFVLDPKNEQKWIREIRIEK